MSSFGLYFLNVTFSIIWYLKPFVSSKTSINKSLILDLLASDCVIGSFFQLIRLYNSWHILYMHDLFLLCSIAHKKEVQKVNQCFLSV